MEVTFSYNIDLCNSIEVKIIADTFINDMRGNYRHNAKIYINGEIAYNYDLAHYSDKGWTDSTYDYELYPYRNVMMAAIMKYHWMKHYDKVEQEHPCAEKEMAWFRNTIDEIQAMQDVLDRTMAKQLNRQAGMYENL